MRIAVFILAGVTSSAAAWASEGPGDATRRYQQAGLDALRAGRYDEAVKELRRAFALDHRPGLLLDLARAHDKLNDPRSVADALQRYLELAPEAPDREQVKKLLTEAGARVQAASAASLTPVVGTVVPQLPEAVREVAPADPCTDIRVRRALDGSVLPYQLEWFHDPIDSAPRNQPVAVSVQAPVSKDIKLYLHYRVAGESDFAAVEMKRHGPDKVARIPADAARGTSLQYFVEARHAVSGGVVFGSGSRVDPNIIYLEAEGDAAAAAGDAQNE